MVKETGDPKRKYSTLDIMWRRDRDGRLYKMVVAGGGLYYVRRRGAACRRGAPPPLELSGSCPSLRAVNLKRNRG
jgi:hypothetical protein